MTTANVGPLEVPLELVLGGRRICLAFYAIERAAPSALTPAERALFDRGKTPKRRGEFCAGRAAARSAVARLAPDLTGFSVLAREVGPDSGRPELFPASAVGVSIAHSGAWAVAAAVERGTVGIDLEQVNLELGPAFQEEAFGRGELTPWLAQARGSAAAISTAWAAKEAVLKWYGVGLRAALQKVRVAPREVSDTSGRLGLEIGLGDAWPGAPREPQHLEGFIAQDGAMVLALVA